VLGPAGLPIPVRAPRRRSDGGRSGWFAVTVLGRESLPGDLLSPIPGHTLVSIRVGGPRLTATRTIRSRPPSATTRRQIASAQRQGLGVGHLDETAGREQAVGLRSFAMDQRHGIVYVAEDREADPPFRGYWANGDPPAMLEDGPGWTSAREAVTWGRQRAPVVLIRLWPDRYFSAGDRQPRGVVLPAWSDKAG
jgi:hypothetical protein